MRDVLRSISERLGDAWAVSRPVQAIVVAAYVLIGVPYNATRFGGSPAFWLVAMLAAQVLIVATLGNLAPRQARLPAGVARSVFSVLLFAGWGMVSALLMALLGVATGLTDDHMLAERVTIGVLFVVPVAIAGAVAVGSHRRYRELVGALEAELDRLRLALAAAEADVAATRAQLRGAITTDLLPRLVALRAASAGGGDGTAVAALHQEVAEDVRALSHRLAGEARPWQPPMRPDRHRTARSLGPLLDAATVIRPISPVTMTVLLVTLAVLWTTRIVGVETSIRAVVAAPWLLVVLTVGERLVRRLADRPVLVRVVVVTATLALASPWGWLAANTPDLRGFFTWSILIVGIGLGWTLALAHASDQRRRILLRDLEATVASLDHAVARTNQQLHLERERLARIVHGPVQDRLAAAAERLAAAPVEGDLAVHQAAALIDEAERLVDSPRPVGIDLAAILADLATVWDGVATVTCTVEPRLLEALASDEAAAETAAEIIREGVSNAVRHGRSRRVEVTISYRCSETFLIEVVGDGAAVTERTRVGLGTRYLEAATLEWRLERDASRGSRLHAVVPWAGGRSAPTPGGLWRP